MLTQLEWEKLNDVITTINRIKNSTLFRTEFLEKLMHIVPFNFADFNIGLIKKNSYPCLVDPVVVSKYDKKFEDDFINLYESTFASMDYVNWVFLSSESLVYRESDLINEEIRKKSPFYLNYLKVFNLVHIAGIVIASNGKFLSAITFYRSEDKGDFADKDLYIMKQLLPHLQLRFEEDLLRKKQGEKSTSFLLKNTFMITDREIEIIGLIYNGYSNSEISVALNIAVNTVKKHIYNIFEKLDVSSRTQLIKFLLNNDLTEVFIKIE